MDREWYSRIMLIGLAFVLGLSVMHSCNKPQHVGIKRDTVVKVIERPVTIRDSVHTKSVLIKSRDTVYYVDKPVEIPCGDTSFVAQSDSVITKTKDTVNMAFTYANRKGYFSLVFKPRPDSIVVNTIQIPVIQPKIMTDLAWVVGAFGIGLGVGAYYGRR